MTTEKRTSDSGIRSAEMHLASLGNGRLTTRTNGLLLKAFAAELLVKSPWFSLVVDLQDVIWIDHLPLLELCLFLAKFAQRYPGICKIRMPQQSARRSFLERWGFLAFLEANNISVDDSQIEESYSETEHSRVLPISHLSSIKAAGDVRRALLMADATLRDVLTRDACLTPTEVAALGDLVIYELCKNVIEHSESPSGGFIIAHASRPTSEQAVVRQKLAAEWEAAFYKTIGEEGVTEIVLGDSGIGIIASLATMASRNNIYSPEQIFIYAFEPYSTRKVESSLHTRGLWCVKQKIKDFGGLLYVRTASQNENVPGQQSRNDKSTTVITAYWDFLNNPEQEEPIFIQDDTQFNGTQIQILLPQRSHSRPQTFVALHTLVGTKKTISPKLYTVSQAPPTIGLDLALQSLIGDELLFIDMSFMSEVWSREAVDGLMRVLCAEMLQGRKRRIWLLNPPERLTNYMQLATSVVHLWQDRAVLLPLLRIANPTQPPAFSYLQEDPLKRSEMPGDTRRARECLTLSLSQALESPPRELSEHTTNLLAEESTWLRDPQIIFHFIITFFIFSF